MNLPSTNSEINPCRHRRTLIYRQPFRNGNAAHLIELCADCGEPTRPPGVWVSRREALARGFNLDELPNIADRPAETQRFSLFDLGGL